MTTKSICPACLGTFRTNKSGLLMRHGFSAHNVRHGASEGWHTGACQGANHQPIGTEAGNDFAMRIARSQEDAADTLESKPAHTIEDATRAAIREALSADIQRASRRGDYERARALQAKIATATADDFRGTSCSGWFYPDALASRARRMDTARAQDCAARRAHAALLREAVAANPAVD
jgi:hypothetical protein